MGLCSNVLYNTLCTDLALVYPQLGDSRFERAIAWPGITTDEFAALNLRNSILSKYTDKNTVAADRAALDLFLENNEACRTWAPPDQLDERDAMLLGILEQTINNVCDPAFGPDPFDRDRIYEAMDVGPGSSVGVVGTSLYEKTAVGRPSCTSESLYEYYLYGASPFSLESEVEHFRFSHYGEVNVVKGSNLSFAAKKREISRIICTEPSVNLLLQKGLGGCLESLLLHRFGICLSTQPKLNRHLAWLGSWSGLYGTIDLRSASDLISLAFCRSMLPRNLLRHIERFRSPMCRLPDGNYAELHMVSSMGNGFTFPLQTLIFACVVAASYEFIGLPLKRSSQYSPGNFAVFGDDIIVEASAYTTVTRLLQLIGHTVNSEKSFNEGSFRESCGGDYVAGKDVRGVYLKKPLISPQCVYDLHNRLQRWSLNHGVRLDLTLALLRCSAPKIWVPPYENDEGGFHAVHRDVVNYAREGSAFYATDTATRSHLYNVYRPDVKGIDLRAARREFIALDRFKIRRLKEKAKAGGKRVTTHPHNSAGILLAAIRGTLRNGQLVSRQETVRYRKTMAVAPGWDYFDGRDDRVLDRHAWAHWVTNGYAIALRTLVKGSPA